MSGPRRAVVLLLRALTALTLVVGAVVIGAEVWVRSAAEQRIETVARAPVRELVIVLGAPPGRLLEARMATACELMVRGAATRMLLSGMPDELPLMQARARTCVRAEDVVVDDGARRTLLTFLRARDAFGVREALVVSQAYHLPRALRLAQATGIDVVGVVAAGEPSVLGWLRERVARIRAAVDVTRLSSAR